MFETISFAEAIIDGSSDAIFVKDVTGRYLLVNQAAAHFIGLPKEKILGRTDREWFRGDSVHELMERDQEIIRRRTWETVDETLTSNDTRIYSASKGPLLNGDGEAIGLIGISRDVTQQKKNEQRLELYAEQLKRSNRELEQFANIVSHDLQTPLRGVNSYLTLLSRQVAESLNPESRHYLRHATESANRMSQLVRRLLDHAKVSYHAPLFTPCDTAVVTMEVLNDLRPVIDDSHAKVHASNLPKVLGDSVQLYQLFQNLLSNALKYRSRADPTIWISAERDGEFWRFSISDNGIGIPPESRTRIFLMFEKLDRTGHTAGLGIGLATCKQVVEAHGGEIWVEANLAGGSVFHFTLPAYHEKTPNLRLLA